MAVGLTMGLAVGLGSGVFTGRLAIALSLGMAMGVPSGLAVGLGGSFSLAAQPTTVMKQNVAHGLTVGLLGGLGTSLTVGVADGLTAGLMTMSLGAVLAVTLLGGLPIWVRYFIGCWQARREGKLPPRVGHFLDWAYDANLLRMSGTAAQFRHREFQDWLSVSMASRAPSSPVEISACAEQLKKAQANEQ